MARAGTSVQYNVNASPVIEDLENSRSLRLQHLRFVGLRFLKGCDGSHTKSSRTSFLQTPVHSPFFAESDLARMASICHIPLYPAQYDLC